MRGTIGAGVVIVAVVAALLWAGGRGGGDAAVRRADGGEARATAEQAVAGDGGLGLGVQAASVDSAARSSARGGGQADPRALTAEYAGPPRESVPLEQPNPGAQPTVTPPILLSEAATEEGKEILAAQPGVKAILDAHLLALRAEIRKSCWNGDDLPGSAKFVAEASYGADGGLLALNLSDSGAPQAVGGCVRETPNLVPAKVEAPGIAVTVRGTLTLP